MTEQRGIIFEGIDASRQAQDRKWGGPEHDDTHLKRDWIAFAVVQLARAEKATTPGNFNYAMIQVAALCVAAVESTNRKAGAKR